MPLTMLVTLDGSPLSEHILGVAPKIAVAAGAAVHLLRVIPPAHALTETQMVYDQRIEEQPFPLAESGGQQAFPRVTEVETADQAAERDRVAAGDYLRPLADRFASLQVHCVVREDEHAAEAIAAYAEEIGADLIAMATHGRGGLAHLLTGSVAESVMRKGAVPVLLFRPNL